MPTLEQMRDRQHETSRIQRGLTPMEKDLLRQVERDRKVEEELKAGKVNKPGR